MVESFPLCHASKMLPRTDTWVQVLGSVTQRHSQALNWARVEQHLLMLWGWPREVQTEARLARPGSGPSEPEERPKNQTTKSFLEEGEPPWGFRGQSQQQSGVCFGKPTPAVPRGPHVAWPAEDPSSAWIIVHDVRLCICVGRGPGDATEVSDSPSSHLSLTTPSVEGKEDIITPILWVRRTKGKR